MKNQVSQQIQQYFLRDSHLLLDNKDLPIPRVHKRYPWIDILTGCSVHKGDVRKTNCSSFYPGVDNDPDGDSKINVLILPKIKLPFNKCLVIIFAFRGAGTS